MSPNGSEAATQATRVEEDLLGSREIPADAYWGVHTLRAVENYQISETKLYQHPNLIRAYALVKKAAAAANKELGALDASKADPIMEACDLMLEQGKAMDQFPIDIYQGGAGTSVNMNVNEVIANIALELLGEPKGAYHIINPNDDVNMSQSTNDTYPTAFRVALYLSAQDLQERIAKLQASFEAKGREFARLVKMGRTQLQDAVPMTVGQEFQAFGVLMAEEYRHVGFMSRLLLEVNLGATAIGTEINTPGGYSSLATQYLAEFSKLPVVPAANLVEATSDTGAYVSFHSALKRIAVKLTKICNDLRLLSSGPRAGLAEIRLPEMAAGSSIMPAKVNPIIPEVANQVAFKVMGNDVTVELAAAGGQLQLNAFEPVIAQACFESLRILKSGMDTLRTRCVDGITVNKDRVAAYVRESVGLVTFLVPVLGHHLCDEVGKQAAETGKSVREVVLERELLTPEKLDQYLSFENIVL